MKDEEYLFVSDVADKKVTARSARNQRTHTGKGGKIRFPSDNLSKKELGQMSGECKSYRLNEPMTWVEFKAMPDDIKVTYIKLLRQKFNVSVRQIAIMMGIDPSSLGKETRRLNLGEGKHSRGIHTQWDEAGWNKWIGKKMVSPEPVEESTPQEITEPFLEEDVSFPEEPNPKAEEADYMEPVPCPYHEVKRAIPHSGSMDFEGDIGEVLETVAVLLGGHMQRFVFPGKYTNRMAKMEG